MNNDALARHVQQLRGCRRCPRMQPPVVSGGPVWSKVLLVGQAPGVHEPKLGKPFAWTAGKTLFRWFQEASGQNEAAVRASIYFAAVCRCFPGKNAAGGDRVPDRVEIANCASWLDAELQILQPTLVIPVGQLAIGQFVEPQPLNEMIGRTLSVQRAGQTFDLIPLPHPSGASPWPRMEPGKTLLRKALQQIVKHPTWRGALAVV